MSIPLHATMDAFQVESLELIVALGVKNRSRADNFKFSEVIGLLPRKDYGMFQCFNYHGCFSLYFSGLFDSDTVKEDSYFTM